MSSLRGKRVVVLGGAGFVGSWLIERLLTEEVAFVLAVDNLCTGAEANLAHLRRDSRVDFLLHDITQPLAITGDVGAVFNLASPASPRDYDRLWLETLRVGSLGTQHALELAEGKGALMLQASTSEIYGDPTVHPQTENYYGNVDSTGPRAVYDEAKRYGEAIVQAFRRKRGVSTRIVRIFNTYGPRMKLDDGRVVPQFIAQALRNEDFTIYGDGTQTRSFCYVTDLVDGLVKLALSNEMNPVNLGNPDEKTIREFAELVRAAAGGGGKIVFRPLPSGDPRQRRPEITRARTLLGWAPLVPLAEGLTNTIEYFRSL